MKRFFAIILSLCLFVGMLSGCSGQEEQPYQPTGNGLTWDEGQTQPTDNEGEDAVQQLTLTYYPDRSMNPYTCNDFTNRALFSLLYQSLFITDYNYHVEPMLCSRYSVTKELDFYTFYIQDATFSDGSALTIKDVAASLKAAKESPVYGGRFSHVSKIALTKDGGVSIKLDSPCEDFLMLLDVPILKKSQLKKDYPLGTGPYFFDDASGGKRLYRRDDWWCNPEMVVTAPSISLVVAESPTQIRDTFEFSTLDLVCADPGSDRYVDFRCDYELLESENGIFLYLACNINSEVFSIPEVRAALTHAIDRDMLVDTYYSGFAHAATLPASPKFPYYSTKLAEQYGLDAAKFTEAVSNAAVRDKPVVFLVNSDDSLRVRVAREIGGMLADCGLVVTMKELSTTKYKEALSIGDYDLYLGQTKLSPTMDLSAFFSGAGGLSYGIDDVAINALCRLALENHGNYYTLHQTIMDDGRLCPILFRSYAIYATRGLLPDMQPSRDNVFYYSLGKTLANALIKE